jgi:hypothetical protein
MKKIVALALSLMMLLGCVSAFAETAEKETITMMGAFNITYDKLPEGYTLNVMTDTEMDYVASITAEDASKPKILLTMAFSDEWDGVNTLADATEEDIAALKQDFYDVTELDDGDIIFEDQQTGMGTPVLVARAVDNAFAAVYTIYMSHEIEVDIFPGDAEEGGVKDEDIQNMLSFLTNVEFAPLAE